jgi:hypothetical protein
VAGDSRMFEQEVDWERFDDVMSNVREYVKFGKDDKPNKYGETKKMIAISDIVEGEKEPREADFEWTQEDIMYYYYCLRNYLDCKEAKGGQKPVIVHYIND